MPSWTFHIRAGNGDARFACLSWLELFICMRCPKPNTTSRPYREIEIPVFRKLRVEPVSPYRVLVFIVGIASDSLS